MPRLVPVGGLLLLCILGACESNDVPVGGGAGDPYGSGNGKKDGSVESDGSDSDASAEDALGCITVEQPDASNNATVIIAGGADEHDFDVTRAYARWDQDCGNPTLVLGLGATSCDPDKGERFVVRIAQEAVGTSVFAGPNTVSTNSTGDLTFLYAIPSEASPEHDNVWRNCTAASGFITFTNIDSVKSSAVTAEFDVTLTDCLDPLSAANARIVGSIDVTVPQNFSEACP
ncbi:MAG: hypothetical protein R3A78_15270 [Polyangiales bacterium]|nr:hypothetical protein [Myxococcales bacterium]